MVVRFGLAETMRPGMNVERDAADPMRTCLMLGTAYGDARDDDDGDQVESSNAVSQHCAKYAHESVGA